MGLPEALVDFFDKGMVQNLVSELVGIAVTLVFVSWLGGYVVRRTLDVAFLRKWGEYRAYVARRLRDVDDRLASGLTSLAADLEGVAGRPAQRLTEEDLDACRRNYDLVLADLDYLVNFMPRHHFALADRDIGPVSDYIAFIADDIEEIFGRELSFRNFEAILATHFRGLYTMEMRMLEQADPARHGRLQRSAADAARALAAVDRRVWADRREAVVAALAAAAGPGRARPAGDSHVA